jgi:cytochrome P450
LITRYANVLAILKEPRFSSDLRKRSTHRPPFFLIRYLPSFLDAVQNSMAMVDDPHHRRLRNLVHQAFTPIRIEAMNSRINALCDEVLEGAAQKSEVDVIADFALPLPLTIISEVLGVPPADRLKFHRWTAQFLNVATSIRSLIVQLPGVIGMYRFLKHLIQLRRVEPQNDLITGLVQANDHGDCLGSEETLAMLFLILLAGHETTVGLIGNGLLGLLEHPDELASYTITRTSSTVPSKNCCATAVPSIRSPHAWRSKTLKSTGAAFRRTAGCCRSLPLPTVMKLSLRTPIVWTSPAIRTGI